MSNPNNTSPANRLQMLAKAFGFKKPRDAIAGEKVVTYSFSTNGSPLNTPAQPPRYTIPVKWGKKMLGDEKMLWGVMSAVHRTGAILVMSNGNDPFNAWFRLHQIMYGPGGVASAYTKPKGKNACSRLRVYVLNTCEEANIMSDRGERLTRGQSLAKKLWNIFIKARRYTVQAAMKQIFLTDKPVDVEELAIQPSNNIEVDDRNDSEDEDEDNDTDSANQDDDEASEGVDQYEEEKMEEIDDFVDDRDSRGENLLNVPPRAPAWSHPSRLSSCLDHQAQQDPWAIFGDTVITEERCTVQNVFEDDDTSNWTMAKFEVAKCVGRGGHGQAFLAREKESKFVVVVKTMSKLGLEGTRKKYLIQEALNQQKLNHPNILKIFGMFWDKESVFLILECAPGGNLFDAQEEVPGRIFSDQDAANYIRQAAIALKVCHDNGILHRDIKSENLLLGHKGVLKLADFGISGYFGREPRKTLVGTPAYAPPEVAAKGNQDETFDIWSLGVVLYELKAYDLPFQMDKGVRIDSHVDFKKGNLKGDVVKLIDKMLARRQGNRISLDAIIQHKWIVDNTKSVL